MNKTIIAIAAALAAGGVTAQAKVLQGTPDALFPYMPKAKAELLKEGFGRPDAFQPKGAKGAVKVDAFKTLTPNVFAKSSETGYLNAPDGSTWFYAMDTVEDETNKGIKSFKITVFDSELKEIGSVEDELTLGENETRIVQLSIGPALTQKFFNFDNNYEIMIGVAANTTQYVNNYSTKIYSLGKTGSVATFDGYYCSAVNAAKDAWSEDFYITFLTTVATETPEVNGVTNTADYRFVTYKKAGYSGMGAPVLDVRFPEICTTGADAVPILATTHDGKPWISISHLKHCWYEDPFDYTNENPAADNELIVDIYTAGSGWSVTSLEKYSTTTIPLNASSEDLYFLYHGNFQYDRDLNLTLSGDGTPLLYITKAHTQRGGDEFSYDYAVYSAAPKGETAEAVKKFDIAEGVSGGTFLNDIPGFDPQVMFIKSDGDGGMFFDFVNVNNGQLEHELDAVISDDYDSPLLLTSNTDRTPYNGSYLYYAPQTYGLSDDEDNVHSQIVFVNPEDGSVVRIDDVNLGQNVAYAQLYSGPEAMDPYLFNLDSNLEYMALVKRRSADSDAIVEELTIRSTDPAKAPLLDLGPDATAGNLANIYIANYGSKTPKLVVEFLNTKDWKMTLQSYDLPLLMFENGDGTAENPYQISTVGGLKQIISAPEAHYAIVNDIDASGYPLNIAEFTFKGSIDGRNHVISNLSLTGRALIPQLTRDASIPDTQSRAADADNKAGIIRDINFVNASLTDANSGQGLLVGSLAGGIIENVHAYESTVKGDEDFGGLVGKAYLYAQIKDCSFQGDLIGGEESSEVGGIASSMLTSATIRACAFKGNINAGAEIGGIVASLNGNAGKVSDCHVNATIKGKNTIGGIAATSGRALIENCHVQGSIEATEAPRWGGGPCAGGIVGNLQPLYTDPSETPSESTPSIAIQGCYANLTSIAFTGTPAAEEAFPGQNDTMHRIVGKSVVNNEPEPIGYDETTWEPIYSDEPVAPDAGLANNYAVATLTVGNDKIEAAATSTEGASVAADETGISFFQELGWNYGNDTENPWNMTGDQFNPALYFEGGLLIFTPSEVTIEAEKEVTLHLQLVGEGITEDMIEGFTFEISDESVAEAGDMGIENGEIYIVIKGLKEGTANISAGIAGKQTQAKITVTAAESGIGSIEVESAGNISLNGNTVSAQGCAINVFSTTGTLVAAGRDTVSLDNVTGGIYIVTATDAEGHRSSLKIRL